MGERRMFAKTICTSDSFLDMGTSARCLYFTLGLFADDDGFCNNPKSIMRQIGASADDMNILIAKKFVLAFESGVIVIKHWRIHNYIRNDRYKETKYKEEKAMLTLDENNAYTMEKTECLPVGIPVVGKRDTQVKLSKDKLSKDKLSKDKKDKYGEFQNVLLTEDEYKKLKEKFPKDYSERIDNLSIYMRSKGKQYKSHYATILSWARKEEKSKPNEIKPKRYKVFEKEEWEKPDFKATQMPDDVREMLGKVGKKID